MDVLRDFAAREGCIIGVCDGEPLPHIPNPDTPFVSKDTAKRTDPAANMPGVKSIIAVGVGNILESFSPMPEDAGILSVLGVTEDYHVVVKKVLRKLAAELEQHTQFKYKIFVDSPNLDERTIAVKAGLGYIGRHGLVISQEFGSWFNIGLMLTDIAITDVQRQVHNASSYSSFSCAPDCNHCIDACPTGALSETNGFKVSRCISYLTQKDSLTSEEAVLIGRNLCGCDICQDVCPKNPSQPVVWANPDDWLNMTDEEFKNMYGHTAMSWLGVARLRRNAQAVKTTLLNLQAPPQS